MLRGEREAMRVEVVDRQVAVRLEDDRARVWLDGACVEFVGEPFLDDDGVVVEGFGLREEVADCDALACAAHAQQDRMLRRGASAGSGKRRHADEVALRSLVERLGVRKVAGECRTEREHVREIARLGVELAVRIAPPRPAGPALEEHLLRRRRQRAGEILRAVHAIDGVLDRRHLRGQPLTRRVPGTNDVFDIEGQRVPLHQRRDFLLLLLHRREEREPLLAGVVARQPVVRLFLPPDLGAGGKRLDIRGDGVVEQRQSGESLHETRMRHLRPAVEHEHRMIESVHPEPGRVRQSLRFAVPAVFVDRKLGLEGVERVVIEALRK